MSNKEITIVSDWLAMGVGARFEIKSSIILINARSYLSTGQFIIVANNVTPTFIFFTETWFTDNIDSILWELNEYDCVGRD